MVRILIISNVCSGHSICIVHTKLIGSNAFKNIVSKSKLAESGSDPRGEKTDPELNLGEKEDPDLDPIPKNNPDPDAA